MKHPRLFPRFRLLFHGHYRLTVIGTGRSMSKKKFLSFHQIPLTARRRKRAFGHLPRVRLANRMSNVKDPLLSGMMMMLMIVHSHLHANRGIKLLTFPQFLHRLFLS
ncbi:hypothetical protein EMPG_14973 [Blastomyces silverae]|uniref:Uncharacterized protein n=1 Tax=Blastomyces silverae TaxID=2060906 RepID=A0A0H1BDR0_9EURO|nr:hypothetical protein EMPG_14973 [Blastomyces silverae]